MLGKMKDEATLFCLRKHQNDIILGQGKIK